MSEVEYGYVCWHKSSFEALLKALYHVFLQDFWSLVGAVISASLIPERWLPGRFDYVFNSHNIMHVLVVLGGLHMHWAMQKDFKWIADNQCPD